MGESARVIEVVRQLARQYPNAKVALDYGNPLELLIATILSAQCTDAKVNEVTKELFKKYLKPEDYAKANTATLRKEIRSLGTYRRKASFIKACCKALVDEFGSSIPRTMDELLTLPGVARKTANIVLSNAFGVIEGIAVDTHVARLSRRLGLTQNKLPEKIEQDLMGVTPRGEWFRMSYLLIDHGRKVCRSRKPLCAECVLNNICPSAFKF
jgi:endonuclease-3